MNTDQPTPPEVTAPAGHEILPQDFLREHGAVEGMKWYSKFSQTWVSSCYVPGSTMKDHDLRLCEDFPYCAPLGTIAALLTPAPEGYRNVLPGWLAGLETRPEGLQWACEHWTNQQFPDDWEIMQDSAWCDLKARKTTDYFTDFAYAVPLSPPKFHNPDNLASAGEPPWRFLVKGEPLEKNDEWCRDGSPWRGLGWAFNFWPRNTYRTRRPLSQKGGDEPCLNATAPIHKSQNESLTTVAQSTGASNAAPTFQPDARPWLLDAKCQQCGSAFGRHGVGKYEWNCPGEFSGQWLETKFTPQPPAPSVPTSGTPRTDELIERIKWQFSGVAIGVLHKCADFARTLERELASVTKELSEEKGSSLAFGAKQLQQISELETALQSAQTCADVAERELANFTGFNLAIYQKTCVHHTDEERAGFHCPVCMKRERDTAQAAEARLREALQGLLSCVDEWEENGFIVLRDKDDPSDTEISLVIKARAAATAPPTAALPDGEELAVASAHYDHSEKDLEPPLLGEWRAHQGYLCCGTLRVARTDFETDPTPEFRREVFEWIANRLNAIAGATK